MTACGCDFAGRPPTGQVSHDDLVGIETLDPPEAARVVAVLIGNSDQSLFEDAGDFGRFVAQHNWTNPAAVFRLGQAVDYAMNGAAEYRFSVVRAHRGAQKVSA